MILNSDLSVSQVSE